MSGVSEGSALTIAFQIEASVGRFPGASSTSWARVPTIFFVPWKGNARHSGLLVRDRRAILDRQNLSLPELSTGAFRWGGEA
jgi:hypothetical protein